jgi:glycosyltransferase involved in cell wall biosynthesis
MPTRPKNDCLVNILHISTYDGLGGAARAAVRLHTGLWQAGENTHLLTFSRTSPGIPNHLVYNALPQGIPSFLTEKARAFFYYRNLKRRLANRPAGYEFFSSPQAPVDIARTTAFQQADIINLHYVTELVDYFGFFAQLAKHWPQKRVVWTMHDMSPFTGGCHHADACEGYTAQCTACPQLRGTAQPTFAQTMLARKKAVLAQLAPAQLHLVSPSRWLLEHAQRSQVFGRFGHTHIRNGVDGTSLRAIGQATAREVLAIPPDKKVILFVANSLDNPRKGFDYLVGALQRLSLATDELVLCAIGTTQARLAGLRYPVLPLGVIADERLMALAYSAADVFVMPSVAENLPNVISESLLCGTPVVAFPRGGMVEMVQPGTNGLLCREVSALALAECLEQFFAQPGGFDRAQIRQAALAQYDLPRQVAQYQALYRSL